MAIDTRTTPRCSGSRAIGRAAVVLLVLFASSSPSLARQAVGNLPTPASAQSAPAIESRPLGSPTKPKLANKADADENQPAEAISPRSILSSSTMRTGGSLAVVLGLIFICAKLLKRLSKGNSGLAAALGSGGPSPSGLLEVLGRYPIGRGSTLVLLRIDNRVLLLSQNSTGGGGLRLRGGGSSVSTLCEITEPEEVASILMRTQDAEQQSISAGFRQLLNRFDGDHSDAAVVDVRPKTGRAARRAIKGATSAPDFVELLDDRADAAVFAEPDSIRARAGSLRRHLETMRSSAAAEGMGGRG